MADTIIRPVTAADQDAWRRLYTGYLIFYHREPTERILSTVWSWLMDPAHEMEGIVADVDGVTVGLANFRRMPSPLRAADIGFLDDLYVAPEARGHGVVQALFSRLDEIGKERGWEIIRWMTADDNYRARSVYDKLARKTPWNLYELKPGGQ